MTHNSYVCSKYNDVALPDESGNCSLCGATMIDLIEKPKVYNFYNSNRKAETKKALFDYLDAFALLSALICFAILLGELLYLTKY